MIWAIVGLLFVQVGLLVWILAHLQVIERNQGVALEALIRVIKKEGLLTRNSG